MFASLHFNNDSRFSLIRQNALALRDGAKGYHVRLLQQGLIDLGHDLPFSTQLYGSPDGQFGGETKSALKKAQAKLGLYDDGVFGTKSVIKFDPPLAAAPGGFAPPPALPGKPDGDAGNEAATFRDTALRAIGPGSPIYKTDSWEINWRPRAGADPIHFKISTFIDYGFSLNGAIVRDDIQFGFVDHPGDAGAEYIPTKRSRYGKSRKANTILLLDKTARDNEPLAIHELTHALLDMERGPRNALFNEMIAYIAGSLYTLNQGYASLGGGEFAAIYSAANDCARLIKLGVTPDQDKLEKLAKAINENPLYRGVRRRRYKNNGVG